MLTRRKFIRSAAIAASVAMIPAAGFSNTADREGSRLDRLVPDIDPMLDLYNPHTKEELRARFFGPTGYDMDAIKKINWLMRDWRQEEVRQIDVRVLWGLAALRSSGIKAGNSGRIHANSAYRTQATNQLLRRLGYGAATKSLHLEAKAIDFTMPGAKVEHLAELAAWLEIGGTGHYRGRFVHIDSGPKRNWHG